MARTATTSSRVLSAALLCLVLLFPLPANADKAEDLLKKAIKHYAMVEFDSSLKLLDKAAKATRKAKLLGQIHLYTGCNLVEKKQEQKAAVAFTTALTHDPDLTMDPHFFKKPIVKVFNNVRGMLRGQLFIKANRRGAVVFVDDKKAGKAPLKRTLPIGQHKVEVVGPKGFYGYSGTALVAPNKTVRLTAHMKRQKINLMVVSTPVGAEVLLGGKFVGKTPLVKEVNAGIHTALLQLSGHLDFTQKVTVAWKKENKLEVKLKQEPQLAMPAWGKEEPAPVKKPDPVKKPTPVGKAKPMPQVSVKSKPPRPPAIKQPERPPPLVTRALEPRLDIVDTSLAEDERRNKTIHAYVALGIGAASLVAASVLYGVAKAEGDDAYDKYSATSNPIAAVQHWDDVEAARNKATVGHVLLGTAAVALGVSLYQLLTRPEVPAGAGSARVGFVPSNGGGLLSLGHSY